MPWTIAERDDQYCVYKEDADGEPSGEALGCHGSRAEAEAQLAALYASEDRRIRAITATMRQAANHSGAMVALFLSEPDAAALALERSALPDGSEPEPADDLHITLAYLGEAAEIEADRSEYAGVVAEFASEAEPISGLVSGIGRFRSANGDPHALYASFDSPDLAYWREQLRLDFAEYSLDINREHGFTPHITLAYIPADAPMPDLLPAEREIHFDTVALAWADDVEVYSLAGKGEEDRSMPKRKTLRELLADIQRALGQIGRPAAGDQPAGETTDTPREARAMPIGSLYEQVAMAAYTAYPMAYLVDVYADDGGALSVLLASEGKLYRCQVSISDGAVSLSEWQPVTVEFQPTGESAEGEAARSRTTLIRQADGRVRWLSQSCSAVLNRVGEIDGTELFDSFVEHAERTGEYPIRQFYHAGEAFRTGQGDFLARDGYVLVTSGLFDDSEIARAEVAAREADPDFWGESIGYDALEAPTMVEIAPGVSLPLYRKGILTEISTLPEKDAAALFTRTTQEVIRMALTGRQLEAFILLFDGDEAKARRWLAEHPDETNRAIAAGKLIARQQAAGEPNPPAVAELPATATAEAEPARAAEPDPEDEEDSEETPEDGKADGAEPEPAEEDGGAVLEPEDGEAEEDDDEETERAAEAWAGAIAEIAAANVMASPEMAGLGQALETLSGQVAELSRQISEANMRAEGTANAIDDRLSALEANASEERSIWNADLPSRLRFGRPPSRPRDQRPADGQDQISMPDLAKSTLEGLP